MQRGISTLKDILSSNCMLSFQELCERYRTEPSSLFLYLRLRSAMKAYGVSWEKVFICIQSLLGFICPLLAISPHGCTERPWRLR